MPIIIKKYKFYTKKTNFIEFIIKLRYYEVWYIVPKYTSEWVGMQTDKDYKS